LFVTVSMQSQASLAIQNVILELVTEASATDSSLMQLLMLLDMQMHVYLPQEQHCYYLANAKFIVLLSC